MNIGFFGTPAISASLLESLLVCHPEWNIRYVVTRSDKAQKRSKVKKESPVATIVSERFANSNIAVFKPELLKEKSFLSAIRQFPVDILLVFSYGKILPAEILDMPSLFAINLHGSLLPELRGPSPIQTAILQGFSTTGWTLQKMTSSLDAGDVFAQASLSITEQDNTRSLTEKMLPLGIQLTQQTLEKIKNNPRDIKTQRQDPHRVTYCHLLQKDQARIPSDLSRWDTHNWIRAHNPKPLSWIPMGKRKLFLLSSHWCEHPPSPNSTPGHSQAALEKFQKGCLYLSCLDGILELTSVKPEGKNLMQGIDFVNGYLRSQKNKASSPSLSSQISGQPTNVLSPSPSPALSL